MNAETILRSDVLDIIFENRNKQYGAYALRKGYDQRLYKSLSIMMGMVLLLLAGYYWKDNGRLDKNQNGFIFDPRDSSVILTKIEIPKERPVIPPQKVASIANPPIKIVPDNQVEKPIRTVDDFENRVISNVTEDGPIAVSDNQATGSAPEPAPASIAAPEPPKEPEILDFAEVPPAFPGGISALIRFLGKNLQVPEDAVEPGQRIKVPVKFVVDKAGNLSDIEFQVEADEKFKREIKRVFDKMPKWIPGSQRGRAVSVYFSIPIIFEVPE
jgi:periplasmic protein TonB